MYYKIYDERTGNPQHDNMARNANRIINRVCRGAFRVSTPRGRRRKKAIMRVEYPRYVRIVNSVARMDQQKQKGAA